MPLLSHNQSWRFTTVNDNILSTYYILDLDRTLLDTEGAALLMRDAASWSNADLAAQLTQKINDSSLYGESFSIRDFIVEQVGEEGLVAIEAKYRELMLNKDVLNPGAQELIDYIHTLPDAVWGILTYGSQSGQTLKIEASGLGSSLYLVTHETFKGDQITSWRDENGLYHLPEELGGYITKKIVFVDDKPFSFKGLAADCRGYWVKSLFDAGKESLPANVTPIQSLLEVIALEKQLSIN